MPLENLYVAVRRQGPCQRHMQDKWHRISKWILCGDLSELWVGLRVVPIAALTWVLPSLPWLCLNFSKPKRLQVRANCDSIHRNAAR